ncbi:hypothetical protein AMK59_7954 [Oryctes borbonicus]|uniref:ABC-2 type transporter transmembrane domain-containing protein n=1 Tax=Oryctes borbonicus TaxID=1629725 RepID=A0A0T6AX53_9SCAR|nr:hypothetical protein AMK59_7954 [Oryctes borbonicus]
MNLANLPISCLGATSFTMIVYFMSGQPIETDRIFLFLVISILYVLASQGFGFVIGAIFNPVKGACIGSAIGIVLVLLASYNMGAGEISNPLMKILTHLSYAYHAYMGFGITAFKNRDPLECPDIFCLFTDPDLLLQQVGMAETAVHTSVTYLVAFTTFHRILAYGFLKSRLKPESLLYQILK